MDHRNDPAGSAGRLTDDEATAVRAAVAALDDDLRAAVVLRCQEDLTLAAIGAAVGCAESTVHERVARGLAALRRRLRGLGFAALAVDLERVLATAAELPIAVPADLLARLCGIPAATGLAAAKVAAVLGLLLGGGGVGYAAFWSAERAAAPPAAAVALVERRGDADSAMVLPVRAEREPAAPQDPERRGAPAPRPAVPAPLPTRPLDAAIPAAPTATVCGTVAGDDGAPLADVEVQARCAALDRKAEPFVRAARTDAQGAFTLALPVLDDSGQDYRLTVRRADWSGVFAEPLLRVRAGDLRRGVDARMHRWARDVVGDWSTDLVVTDAAGRPVPTATAVVYRRTPGADGIEGRIEEARAKVVDGRAALRGDHRGEKELRVVAFNEPFVPAELTFTVRDATPPLLTVTLLPDTPRTVRVVEGRTEAPIAGVVVHAERDGRTLSAGVSDRNGLLTFRGLDGGPVDFVGGNAPWSQFKLEGVATDGGTTVLRLRRRDDPDGPGLGAPGIHGRVVDGATGEPIACEAGAVGLSWLRTESTTTREQLLAEAITPWPFQTAADHDAPPPSPEFHLEVQSAGRYAVVARVPGYAVAVAGPFDVAGGAAVRGVELRLERGGAVTAVVRDAAGRPVADAEVWLAGTGAAAAAERAERCAAVDSAARSGVPARGGRGLRTDAEGRVTFALVPTSVDLCVHVVAGERQGASAPLRAQASGAAEIAVTVR